MTNAALAPEGRRLTGRKVLVIFACFFGTIFTANAFLVTSALRTWSGAETTSAYKAGQLYNEELRHAREQAALGWRLEANATRGEGGGALVTVSALGPGGTALSGRTLAGTLQRPVFQRDDKSFLLEEVSPGSYVAEVAGVAAGQWELVVDVIEDGESAFKRKTRVILR